MLAAVLASTGEQVGWTAVVLAVIGLASAILEHRHSERMKTLEQKNDEQHARGYGLLESIDTRTIGMVDTLADHGQRLSVVETEVKHLQPQKVALEATPTGRIVATVESPHKESNDAAAGAEAGQGRGSGTGA